MPIFKKIKGFFKRVFKPEKIIDPARHHKEHEKYYNIARDVQKEYNWKKKTALSYTSKVLKLPRAELSDIDRDIIEAWSP